MNQNSPDSLATLKKRQRDHQFQSSYKLFQKIQQDSAVEESLYPNYDERSLVDSVKKDSLYRARISKHRSISLILGDLDSRKDDRIRSLSSRKQKEQARSLPKPHSNDLIDFLSLQSSEEKKEPEQMSLPSSKVVGITPQESEEDIGYHIRLAQQGFNPSRTTMLAQQFEEIRETNEENEDKRTGMDKSKNSILEPSKGDASIVEKSFTSVADKTSILIDVPRRTSQKSAWIPTDEDRDGRTTEKKSMMKSSFHKSQRSSQGSLISSSQQTKKTGKAEGSPLDLKHDLTFKLTPLPKESNMFKPLIKQEIIKSPPKRLRQTPKPTVSQKSPSILPEVKQMEQEKRRESLNISPQWNNSDLAAEIDKHFMSSDEKSRITKGKGVIQETGDSLDHDESMKKSPNSKATHDSAQGDNSRNNHLREVEGSTEFLGEDHKHDILSLKAAQINLGQITNRQAKQQSPVATSSSKKEKMGTKKRQPRPQDIYGKETAQVSRQICLDGIRQNKLATPKVQSRAPARRSKKTSPESSQQEYTDGGRLRTEKHDSVNNSTQMSVAQAAFDGPKLEVKLFDSAQIDPIKRPLEEVDQSLEQSPERKPIPDSKFSSPCFGAQEIANPKVLSQINDVPQVQQDLEPLKLQTRISITQDGNFNRRKDSPRLQQPGSTHDPAIHESWEEPANSLVAQSQIGNQQVFSRQQLDETRELIRRGEEIQRQLLKLNLNISPPGSDPLQSLREDRPSQIRPGYTFSSGVTEYKSFSDKQTSGRLREEHLEMVRGLGLNNLEIFTHAPNFDLAPSSKRKRGASFKPPALSQHEIHLIHRSFSKKSKQQKKSLMMVNGQLMQVMMQPVKSSLSKKKLDEMSVKQLKSELAKKKNRIQKLKAFQAKNQSAEFISQGNFALPLGIPFSPTVPTQDMTFQTSSIDKQADSIKLNMGSLKLEKALDESVEGVETSTRDKNVRIQESNSTSIQNSPRLLPTQNLFEPPSSSLQKDSMGRNSLFSSQESASKRSGRLNVPQEQLKKIRRKFKKYNTQLEKQDSKRFKPKSRSPRVKKQQTLKGSTHIQQPRGVINVTPLDDTNASTDTRLNIQEFHEKGKQNSINLQGGISPFTNGSSVRSSSVMNTSQGGLAMKTQAPSHLKTFSNINQALNSAMHDARQQPISPASGAPAGRSRLSQRQRTEQSPNSWSSGSPSRKFKKASLLQQSKTKFSKFGRSNLMLSMDGVAPAKDVRLPNIIDRAPTTSTNKRTSPQSRLLRASPRMRRSQDLGRSKYSNFITSWQPSNSVFIQKGSQSSQTRPRLVNDYLFSNQKRMVGIYSLQGMQPEFQNNFG